jgi:C-terminal processing protease CtpA/Prc
MLTRATEAFAAACLLIAPGLPARAENQMGYRLLSPQEAAELPRNRGALGLDVERGSQITDSGMTFAIIRVKQVKPGSTGGRAGLKTGDQIIALDGRVFSTLAAFAAYIGSASPGSQMMVDYMPAGGGPQQAQRATVTVGQAGQTAPPMTEAERHGGLSTSSKIAIGAGAVALFGCYRMGCFSHHGDTQQPAR